MGTIPSSGIFFVIYEMSKEYMLQKANASHHLSIVPAPAVAYVVGSTLAEFASCCVRTPFELLKQQMQLGMHTSAMAGINAIYHQHRWKGFFVGFSATLVRDLPFVGVEIALWEGLKQYFLSLTGDECSAALTSFSSGFAGLLAGAGAALLTNPLDVVKTRLMTQREGRYTYKGYYDCFSTILRKEGVRALFLGLQLRILWISIGGCLLLGGYDAFKIFYQRLLLPPQQRQRLQSPLLHQPQEQQQQQQLKLQEPQQQQELQQQQRKKEHLQQKPQQRQEEPQQQLERPLQQQEQQQHRQEQPQQQK